MPPFLREDGIGSYGRLSPPDEILNAALAEERQARQFYAGPAEQCQIATVKRLFEKLKKDEENKHVKMIEKMEAGLRLGGSLR